MALTFRRYTYANPDQLPVGQDGFLGDHEWDDVCASAGFDPADDEVGTGNLTAAWNGHPAGALVVSGCTVEGHPFAVSNELP